MIAALQASTGTSEPGVRGHDGRLLERALPHAARARCDRRRPAPPRRRPRRPARAPVPAALVERAARRRRAADGRAQPTPSSRTRSSTRATRPASSPRRSSSAGRTPRRSSSSNGAARSSACGSPASGWASGRAGSPAPTPRSRPTRPAAASLLALLGAVAFVAGAALVLWPIWAAGHRARRRRSARPQAVTAPPANRSHFEMRNWPAALDAGKLLPRPTPRFRRGPGGSSSARSIRWRGLGRCRRGASEPLERLLAAEQLDALEQPR